MAQNRALKDELRKWTSDGADALPPPAREAAASLVAAAAAGRAPADADGSGQEGLESEEAEAESWLERIGLAAADGPRRPVWATRPQTAPVRESAPAAAGRFKLDDTSADAAVAAADSRLRGRFKLEEAKSALALSGSAPQFAERPTNVTQSSRGTASQAHARLAEVQRRRSDLARKRGTVRNYARGDAD